MLGVAAVVTIVAGALGLAGGLACVAASAAADFAGKITALWTESRGDTAIAIVNDPETGSYEAFRLAVACDQ